jgi:hypothetical protein
MNFNDIVYSVYCLFNCMLIVWYAFGIKSIKYLCYKSIPFDSTLKTLHVKAIFWEMLL